MSDKPKDNPLETGWVLAYELANPKYIAFRTEKPMDSNSVLHRVRTLTRFTMERDTVDGEPMMFMVPQTPIVKGFNLINHDTLVTIDLSGFAWWTLTDWGTIDEILKIWIPERMTAEEKKAMEQRKDEARQGPSKILKPGDLGGGMPVTPRIASKVARQLAKLNQGRGR